MLEVIISAVMSFIGTNIDDLFVDTLFFAEAEAGETGENDRNWGGRIRGIVTGKYLGIGALVLVSLLGAFGLQLLPGKYIGLLGLVPMGLGVKAGFAYFRERKHGQSEGVPKKTGDVGIQGEEESACLQKSRSLLWSVTLVTIAKRLADLPLLKKFLMGHKGVIVPVVFIALGVYIMVENFW